MFDFQKRKVYDKAKSYNKEIIRVIRENKFDRDKSSRKEFDIYLGGDTKRGL